MVLVPWAGVKVQGRLVGTVRTGSALRALAVDTNRKYASPVTAVRQACHLSEVHLLHDVPTAKVFCAAYACTRLSLITKT